jgi:hypothetical protein
VAEHNRHASLVEYDIAPLKESMKIHYFEEGIKDPTLDAAWNAILVNRMQFPDFDSVMHLYVTSKRSQKLSDTGSPGQQLSAITGCGLEVEAAAGPAVVVAVGVTPMPDRRGLFLKLTSTASQDAKVDLKALIVAVMPIYCLSETINLFFFLFLCVFNKLIIFSVS